MKNMQEQRFHDRTEAGKLLASKLTAYVNHPNVLVLALPRGGVPVAFEVARALHAPLDVLVVRKLGVPGYEELAMGAIASGGVQVINDGVVQMLGISEAAINKVAVAAQHEVERREHLYRGDRRTSGIQGRTIILVDDGIATGATMRAAVTAVRQQHAARIVIAVPVAAAATCQEFGAQIDELVSVIKPEALYAVGIWYEHFPQTTDEEVRELLERAAHDPRLTAAATKSPAQSAVSRKPEPHRHR